MKVARFVLPALALVALVGTACTPVKQQFGRNILAFSITNGCLPGLPSNEPMNGFRSPSNNFSRQVCGNGVASHAVGSDGVTMQVAKSQPNPGGFPVGQTGSSISFVTGGVNNLGAINTISILKSAGSSNVTVSIVLDANRDGQFLAPPNADGSGGGFGGDAIASFVQPVDNNSGGQRTFLNADLLTVFFAPCNFVNPLAACLKPGPDGGGTTRLSTLKQGFHTTPNGDTIDGGTPAVIAVGIASTQDGLTTVHGVDVNGTQFLP